MRKIFTAFMMMLCAVCMASAANYLTFTAEEDSSTFGIDFGKNINPNVQYSLDGGNTWKELTNGDTAVLVHKGDKALLKGNNPHEFSRSTEPYSSASFTMTGKIAASGSVMSLIDGVGLSTEIPCDFCFYSLFRLCANLTQAPELPATKLTKGCYLKMFSSCMSLTQAPELPATTLAEHCYESMFWNCTGLTQTPELPATTLADSCYFGMFYGCTSLTQAPELPATTLTIYCYESMFYGCTSLTQAPELPATVLAGNCYDEMFSGCTSLTQAPELSATTMAKACYYGMFRGCTSLTQAPKLPATTLAKLCYSYMFSNCSSLTQAPELPATTLADGCYGGMFSGCTSLTQAPELPATTLANNCYNSMFSGCTSLTQAPELPVTALAERCYSGMFYLCTSLTQAPELPATTLTIYCYESMFQGCISLTQAPELPATTLDAYCYKDMFASCASLTQAPELPATTLKKQCYYGMFYGCKNLSQIHVSFESWGNNEETNGWVQYVASTGTFICPKDLPLEYRISRIPKGWTAQYVDDTVAIHDTVVVETNYLTFTAEEDGSSFGIVNNGGNNPDVQYSLDGGKTWTALAGGDSVLLAHKGDKALLKGNNPQGFSKDYDHYSAFKMIGKVAASGSVMSLIDSTGLSTKIPKSYCFLYLFKDCTSLTQAPELPATTLVESCYVEMFSGCTSLTQAPELPATTLADGCYYGMFSDCTSLTQAPELPVTSLSFYCYAGMFSGCTSLTQAPELPATTLAEGCYATMFWNCTSLTRAPELPATTLAVDCYRNMFQGCTSLTQAPELPATTLADNCYFGMFKGCASLTQAPELPATTLNRGCYSEMFISCTSLSEIKVSFDDWKDEDYTLEWVVDVAPTGTFICPKTLALEYGISWIPEGWTVKYIEDMANYLTFTAEEDSSTFGFVNARKNNPNVQYSLDGGETWTSLAEGKTVVLAHKGDKALLRGDNPKGFSKDWYQYSYFKMTGKVAASGSVMSLIDGIGLSTKIPDSSSFYSLFGDCTSLTQAPELPATTLMPGCYWYMFSGCTGLTQAPALPATTLAEICYGDMFENCTSLTQAPELPATTLEPTCYQSMFAGCTGLTQAPELPATTLAIFCYKLMFAGCTSLTRAPELPAATLVEWCYAQMFANCSNLTEINVSFDEWPVDNYATPDWVLDVAPTGTFICPKALHLECGANRIPAGWTVKYIEDTVAAETNYLTFTAEEDGSTFGIVNKGGNNPDIQYSLDGGETWTALATGDTITLAHKGDKALLRGDNPEGFSKDEYSKYSSFTMTGKIAASGSVMSLIDGTGLSTEIPNSHCFFGLFEYCSGLTQAPELPATTLAEACYSFMFAGCTSLTQAPELPATTLVGLCYNCIFVGCESLSQIRVSFDEWSNVFTGDWAVSVAPTGTFICPKTLPLEYGDGRIPEGWTVKYIEDGSGVNTTLANNIAVWSDDLTIFVCGAEGEVSLYDMSGKRVAVSNSADEERALSVPAKGAYVVRTSGGERSVLVR